MEMVPDPVMVDNETDRDSGRMAVRFELGEEITVGTRASTMPPNYGGSAQRGGIKILSFSKIPVYSIRVRANM